jgi:ankyrin repeat protein
MDYAADVEPAVRAISLAEAVQAQRNDTLAHTSTLEEVRRVEQAAANIRIALASSNPHLLQDLDVLVHSGTSGKCNVNTTGPGGSTPLIMACTQGDVDDVRMLLAAGADPTLEGGEWQPADPAEGRCREFPLSIAASYNHTAIMELLIADERVDVNQATTDTGGTALHCAGNHGHVQAVTILLRCEGVNADPAMSVDSDTPLYGACDEGHPEVVKLLLAAGADVNKARSDDGSAPLYPACGKGHAEVVKVPPPPGISGPRVHIR